MPKNTSQIIGVKPTVTAQPQIAVIPNQSSGCKHALQGGCIKEAELAVIRNDIEKLKDAAQDSSDGKSIELNLDTKLQIKDFDEAEVGSVVMKESADSVKWVKPELVAVPNADDDYYCLELQLN